MNIISIGFLIDSEEKTYIKKFIENVAVSLEQDLIKDFNDFNWMIRIIERRDFVKEAPVDPLELLDYGSSLKLEYNFDFILVWTSLPLKPRFNQFVNAVPSNMLETSVISIARIIEASSEMEKNLNSALALTKHNLGHLWGLEHNDNSVMKPLNVWSEDVELTWEKDEKEHIKEYLKKIADPRIEEIFEKRLSKFLFYMKFLKQEGLSIIRDILVLRSWLTILHLSKFIATIVVSTIFLFLTAEFWELGAHLGSIWLLPTVFFILTGVCLSLYFGQNLHKIGRYDRLKEQAVRSKIVIIGTLFIGISALWIFLFFISLGLIILLPEKILISWAGIEGELPIFQFALLISTFGIMMSAFGGNLEEEDDLKAILFYTEET